MLKNSIIPMLRLYTSITRHTAVGFSADRTDRFDDARQPATPLSPSEETFSRRRLPFYSLVMTLLLVSLLLHSVQVPHTQLIQEGPALIHDQSKLVTVAQHHAVRFLYIMHQPAQADNMLARLMLALVFGLRYIRLRLPLHQDIYKLLLRLLLRPNKFRSTFVGSCFSPV